ncbi:MAG: gas vesicle protein K [Nitrosomonas sp.]|nr:gas vesicle protein K [Nitrosomonas sp.]MDP1951889.1 gas vesicle protein K [Nitrosomonas sp.]
MNTLDFMNTKQEKMDADSPQRIKLDPNKMRKGLAQLVLTVIELLRQLLEKQALRRMEGGSLTEEEVERLGFALLQLSEQMDWFRKEFDLTEEDLNLDLGPLGKLL